MSKLFKRLNSGEPALGTLLLASSPEWVDIAGTVGLDFICIDLMFGSVDWDRAAHMMRAAKMYDMTPMIRLQGYPWGGNPDQRTLADLNRALSIGAESVTMSLDTPAEVASMLPLARDPHRYIHLYTSYEVKGQGEPNTATSAAERETLKQLEDRMEAQTLIMPLLESSGAIAQIDEILAVKGLRAVFLGLGDLSRRGVVGSPGNMEHPDTTALVGKIARSGRSRGVHVFTIAGLQDTPERALERARLLWNAGVDGIFLPMFTFLVQRFHEKALPLIRSELAKETREK